MFIVEGLVVICIFYNMTHNMKSVLVGGSDFSGMCVPGSLHPLPHPLSPFLFPVPPSPSTFPLPPSPISNFAFPLLRVSLSPAPGNSYSMYLYI